MKIRLLGKYIKPIYLKHCLNETIQFKFDARNFYKIAADAKIKELEESNQAC